MGSAAGRGGGKGERELELIPLRSHLPVFDRSSCFVAANNGTGCAAKMPCKEKKSLLTPGESRLSPYRFSEALAKHSKERVTGNINGRW